MAILLLTMATLTRCCSVLLGILRLGHPVLTPSRASAILLLLRQLLASQPSLQARYLVITPSSCRHRSRAYRRPSCVP
eukprot:scaffold29334_cov42-Phaeocystis_antarctica.AAC.3